MQTFPIKVRKHLKKTPFSETFCFSSQSTSGHTGCFFDGPAEQSRTKFWKLFAQCPKSELGNFVKQKIFRRNFYRTRMVKFWKPCQTFSPKIQKTHCRRPEFFFKLSHSLGRNVPRHKVPLAEKNSSFEGPADQKKDKGLETFLSKSENLF